MAWVELAAGPIEYTDTGGDGPVLVLLPGLMMDGRLWDDVVAALRDDDPQLRCICPTLPFGSHTRPMRGDADQSLGGMGRIVAGFLDALELTDVTLGFNDWSGAQTMIADGLMGRVTRLVLTPCEAYENYPPGNAELAIGAAVALPGGLRLLRRVLVTRWLRRLPPIYGQMTKRGVPDALMRAWLEPLRRPEIQADLRRYARTVREGKRAMLAATPALRAFGAPVLVAWSTEGRMMPPEHGPRLAGDFPNARLVAVPDSYTLMPIDQPAALASEIGAFVREGGQ